MHTRISPTFGLKFVLELFPSSSSLIETFRSKSIIQEHLYPPQMRYISPTNAVPTHVRLQACFAILYVRSPVVNNQLKYRKKGICKRVQGLMACACNSIHLHKLIRSQNNSMRKCMKTGLQLVKELVENRDIVWAIPQYTMVSILLNWRYSNIEMQVQICSVTVKRIHKQCVKCSSIQHVSDSIWFIVPWTLWIWNMVFLDKLSNAFLNGMNRRVANPSSCHAYQQYMHKLINNLHQVLENTRSPCTLRANVFIVTLCS